LSDFYNGRKKRLYWYTCFGQITVREQTYRRGRGGPQVRPFAEGAVVRCRAYSQPLQRMITDFGAEVAFGRVPEKLREHYGIEVPASAAREVTERHAQALLGRQEVRTELAAGPGLAQVIGEMDGSLVPVVTTRAGVADRRKTRRVGWQEARLCLAHAPGSVSPRFGATLGKVEEAGDRLADCVIRVGGTADTKLHCVGDGAQWIVEQVERHFGSQASYLIDFYHVSEYLAAAAGPIAGAEAHAWLGEQQERLKNNRLRSVLGALRPHLEAARVAEGEAPVRACYRYLANRAQYLDYRGALAADLPIGSGEVESAHRYVVQARLKLAGAWWQAQNAEKMLALRVTRANGEWQAYWQGLSQAAA
jgi:Uncharacterised protein family (UPF0236)